MNGTRKAAKHNTNNPRRASRGFNGRAVGFILLSGIGPVLSFFRVQYYKNKTSGKTAGQQEKTNIMEISMAVRIQPQWELWDV